MADVHAYGIGFQRHQPVRTISWACPPDVAPSASTARDGVDTGGNSWARDGSAQRGGKRAAWPVLTLYRHNQAGAAGCGRFGATSAPRRPG